MHGFAIALQPTNLMFALMGCLLGTLVGVLPGLGPAAGTAMLIPITFVLDPTPAIIMLAAIYYGAMYGGTITSVLVNIPGEAASAITCIEGYEMAKRGRAGAALAYRRHRLLHRGQRRHHGAGAGGPSPDGPGPEVRSARVLLPDDRGTLPGHGSRR